MTHHNLKQLKKLNQVVFPVSYNDKFYKDVLEVGELAKLGEQPSMRIGNHVDVDSLHLVLVAVSSRVLSPKLAGQTIFQFIAVEGSVFSPVNCVVFIASAVIVR